MFTAFTYYWFKMATKNKVDFGNVIVKEDTDNTDIKGLPAIVDGTFFTIMKTEGVKITVKCVMCPSTTLHAQLNATSNLLKHLKVCNSIISCLWFGLVGCFNALRPINTYRS
jgi:hypothetical protein